MTKIFKGANEAYEYLHDRILQDGVEFGDTRALFNVGVYITDPKDRKIINRERNWKGDNSQWQVEITINGRSNLDPKIYTGKEAQAKMYEYYKYYYDKNI